MPSAYVPDRGDVVWLDFTPQSGHVQAGRRPGLVLSPKAYNGKTGLMPCVPITNQIKHYPFEVVLSAGATGVALADQVKNVDWRARRAEWKSHACPVDVVQICERVGALLKLTRP